MGAGKDVVLKSLSRPGAASYSLLGRDPWLPTYEERVPALHRIGKWENYPLPCWQPAIRGAFIFGFALTLRHLYTQVPVSLPYFPWRCGNQHCAFGSPSHYYCETIGSVFFSSCPNSLIIEAISYSTTRQCREGLTVGAVLSMWLKSISLPTLETWGSCCV